MMMMEDHVSCCKESYRVSEMQLFGKRCNKVVHLYYNPTSGIFYEATEANLKRASSNHALARGPFSFIQNTKLSFYIQRKGGVIVEYFRDSYEGWYINKYVHGHKIALTNSESVRLCQCKSGLEMNSASFELAQQE